MLPVWNDVVYQHWSSISEYILSAERAHLYEMSWFTSLHALVQYILGTDLPQVIPNISLKADLHGTTLSYAINLRQVYDMNRFV